MDKGAHFHRCDFQVHSPRDRQWTGNKFGVSSDQISSLDQAQKDQIIQERIQFAKEYLEKIRAQNIDAIAITDHHDFVFAKLIRKVAQELNTDFTTRKEFHKIVTVFPGLELSLSNPASQCLIIFDADFEDDNLDRVLHFLGIDPTNEFDQNTVETTRISQEIIPNLNDLNRRLDENAYCKGRYIILPNVSDGGQHSILRQGFHEHYRKMHCVGGYVDKNISQDLGYINKINGGDVHYGNKAIAIISTSDNRFEDGRYFGQYSTWIKWAIPTAEAIRQACLGKESRISQAEPELPQIYIKSIDVTASKFLSSFTLNFNQQYNTLIGGRGTGKSTIFEYLRWGLCDQTPTYIDFDELSGIEKRRNALIQKTLVDFKGEVRVTVEKNGILHIVKRNSETKEIQIKIGEGDFILVNEDEIRKLLPVQSYSQKQLSDVGIKTEELKRFIDQPILSQLDRIRTQIIDIGGKQTKAYNSLVLAKELEKEIDSLNLESKSLTIQIDNIRKSLKGIDTEDQKIINDKSGIEIEKTIVQNLGKEIDVFRIKAREILELLKIYPEPLGGTEALINKDLIQELSNSIDNKFQEINRVASEFGNIFSDESMKEFNELKSKWEKLVNEYDIKYETAKSKSQSSQQQLSEIQKIEKRITEISNLLSDRRNQLKNIGDPKQDFVALRSEWIKLHNEKVLLLNSQSIQFEQLSQNLIKAEVSRCINLENFKNQIRSVLEGSRIREERVDALIKKVKESDDTISDYIKLLDELRALAELKLSDDKLTVVPITPFLNECGFNEEHKLKLSNKLTPDIWIKIAVAELEFIPEFYYKTNNQLGDVIPFSAASAGQQATALLTVLLNQGGIPLIIDQPEDDIDNKAIDQIIKNIWDAKKKRQLIFTSHNANLVVNGDSELVVCCDYKDSTSQTRGIIKYEGAIDSKDVKKEITAVMEGGEKAFILRKEKYGF